MSSSASMHPYQTKSREELPAAANKLLNEQRSGTQRQRDREQIQAYRMAIQEQTQYQVGEAPGRPGRNHTSSSKQ